MNYAFWMVVALVGFVAAAAAERVLWPTLPDGRTVPRILAVGAVSAVPITFLVAWAFAVVQQGRTFTPVQLLAVFPFVALVRGLPKSSTAHD